MEKELLTLFTTLGFFGIDTKNFVSPDGEIEEGEKELGLMSELEKNCFTFLVQSQKEHDEVHEKLRSCKDEDRSTLEAQHNKMHSSKNLIRDTMVASIHERFPNLPEGANGIVLREGFKIVASFEDKRQHLPFPLGMVGMMIIESK